MTDLTPCPHGLIGWVYDVDQRFKPLDLKFFDKQMDALLEADLTLETLTQEHPLMTAFVKIADRMIQVVFVDTTDTHALERLKTEVQGWFDTEGIRTYSIKRRYDQTGFIVTPLEDLGDFTPQSGTLPPALGQLMYDIPLSMSHLEVEAVTA